MRSSTYIAMFAASAVAQESATVLDLLGYMDILTFVGSDASATTYENSCASDAVGVTAVPTRPCHVPFSSSAPTPTAKPRLRRQDESCSAFPSNFCEPFSLIQGASTWEYHLTDPVPGVYTVDIACSWQGKVTEADLTCTSALARSISESGLLSTTYTSTWKPSDVQDFEAYETIRLVRTSGDYSGLPSVSASQTSSESGTGGASPTASGSGSGSVTATQSTALAPAGPLPTHAMALVGGALGIFAAAIAL